MALCDTQHAGKEIVTRPMSEYFANDPECHDLLPCTLRSHRVARLGGCPTGTPVGGVTSTCDTHICSTAKYNAVLLLMLTWTYDATSNSNINTCCPQFYVFIVVKCPTVSGRCLYL